MTPNESSIVADAQAAYYRVLERINDPERRVKLARIGLMGLLDMNLETEYLDENQEALG